MQSLDSIYKLYFENIDLLKNQRENIRKMTTNFLNKQERGLKLNIGDTDRLHTSIYSKIKPLRLWNVDATRNSVDGSGYGGIFNLEFSPDG